MASYPPPNNQQGSIFNPIDWIEPNAGSIDTAYLNEHYCQFPVAQGSMSFAGINNTGSTTIKQNLIMTGTGNINYLEFPDGTKQYTAVAGGDILNDDNTWTGYNTFSLALTTSSIIISDDEVLTTLTNTVDGLNISTAVTLPAQTTYTPSTTYGDVASTQQFVQQALASQGGGDAVLAGTNNFTGINSFTIAPTTSASIVPNSSPNTLATVGYINGLVQSFWSTNVLSGGQTVSGPQVNTSNVNGSLNGYYLGVSVINFGTGSITFTANIIEGGGSSDSCVLQLSGPLTPNNVYSNQLTSLTGNIINSYNQVKGVQISYGYNNILLYYYLQLDTNDKNYFFQTDNYTFNYSGYVNYQPS